MTTLSRVKGELVCRFICGTRHETSDILRSRVQRGVFRFVPPKNTRDRSVSVEVVAELAAGLEHRLAPLFPPFCPHFRVILIPTQNQSNPLET